MRRESTLVGRTVSKTIKYIVCIFLAILSIMPFWIMMMNATRGTYEIQQNSISLLPSTYLISNFKVFEGKAFNPMVGFKNSLIIAGGATVLESISHALPHMPW